ncbi:MAG: GSCFA domain-containing protein [Phocaeicola sp.]
MELKTQVELPQKESEIRYSDQIVVLGSCFAKNIGKLLTTSKFQCEVNPFGVLYNPLSIAKSIEQLLEKREYTHDDLFCSYGLWHSWMHHSSFSNTEADICLDQINERLLNASATLESTDVLILTWGTSFVYELNETGMIVGNCHKQPDSLFTRRRISVDEIVSTYEFLFEELLKQTPHLRIILTVSPIRHTKDGMHNNQLSKATLLLAIDKLQKRFENCFYFPAYELLLDELRDYRFYADDMLHPSSLAIQYIWEAFKSTYFRVDTTRLLKEWEEIEKALNHRPFNEESEGYRRFLTQLVLRIAAMKEKFPYFEIQKELEICQRRLNK